jgi:2-methylaconitate cis-trans-isomerase PrpF
VIDIGAKVRCNHGVWEVDSITTQRTARRIMEGTVLVPQRMLEGKPWFETGTL